MAASTAVSTLVLAIEARNQTAAAFAQIRSALAGQVTAAREAAQQQLLANKQALAQQVLAQRQAMEQQVAAIRAGGGATAAAQVTAARHAYAQQVLAARQSAEQQAAAIKGGLAQQVDAYRAAARQEEAALRSVGHGGPTAGAGGAPHRSGEGERGFLSGMADFGKQMLIWNYAAGAINRVTEAVGGFASGLVTSNATLEQMTQTFSAIYGSADKGAQAVRWLDDFAQKVPATREEVMQAGLSLASMGDNIGAVLPRLSNVAAVMGVDLPTAAQALNDAMTGDTQMLRQRLHIQIADLEQFGAKVEANGHIVEGTLLPAFQKLADARFGEKGPLGKSGIQAQMETFTGKMSNVADAITRLQEIAGRGVFDVIKGGLDGVIKGLQGQDVMVWAWRFGEGLAHVLEGVIHLAKWIGQILPAIVNAAIDIMNGDWKHAKDDLLVVWKGIEVGVLQIVRALIDGIITAFHALAGPIATLLNAVFPPLFAGIVNLGVQLFTYLTLKIEQSFQTMLTKVLGHTSAVISGLKGFLSVVMPATALADTLSFLKTGGKGPHVLTDKEIKAQAGTAGGAAGAAADALARAFPIPTIDFNLKETLKAVHAPLDDLIAAVGYKPGERRKLPQKKLPKWLQDMLDAQGGAGSPAPPAGTDYGTGPGAREAAAAARDRVAEQRDAFQLLLSRGPVTWAAGIKDIGAIASAERAAGTSKTQVTLDILGSTKQLIDALLKQARDHFDLDRAHHAGQKTLLADENAYLAILARTPGITKDQLALARIDLDKERGAATPAAKAVAAYKQAGFDLTSGASYGTTTVTLGPVRDQLIAHLQAQLIELRGQKVRDEKQIAILQDELHEAIKGNQYLQAIVNNTAGTHQATQKTAQHVGKPQPRSGAHGFTQRTGVPVPI